MKKVINDATNVVDDMIEGLVASHRGVLARVGRLPVIVHATPLAAEQRVVLISGGGSGHEPAHAGFVGVGMLAGAVLGDVFTSPSVDVIVACIRQVYPPRRADGSEGVLMIVKNYTGDRLNFGLAMSMMRAEGLHVDMVIVGDDCALPSPSLDSYSTRRGIAGTVLVHKIAGATAANGAPLAEVARVARDVAASVRTMGVALGPCTIPSAGKPSFTLGADEIELGLGIHGEPGRSKASLKRADALVADLLTHITNDLATNAPAIVADERADEHHRRGAHVLLVNGLGGTTAMELYIVAQTATKQLSEQFGIEVSTVVVGTLMSALEMAGFSLSLLPSNELVLTSLMAPTQAPGWPRLYAASHTVATHVEPVGGHAAAAAGETPAQPRSHPEALAFERVVQGVIDTLLTHADELTELDRLAGDGDLGISLSRGFKALAARLPSIAFDTPATALKQMGFLLREHLGGSSGPLYGIFCLQAAAALPLDAPGSQLTAQQWAAALQAGADAISTLGGAKRGDRTMLDSLLPTLEEFTRQAQQQQSSSGQALDLAHVAHVATQSADGTKGMFPRKGRAAYLGERASEHRDGGAVAVALIVESICRNLAQ